MDIVYLAKRHKNPPPLSLDEAHRLRVCRICRGKDEPRSDPSGYRDVFVMNYGKEYAHASCLGWPVSFKH